MKEKGMPTMIMTEEQDRDALATRMRGAILSGLIPKNDRAEEELFKGMDQRMVLGAIATLAESLIVYVGWASGEKCDWARMVDEVRGEMLRWVKEDLSEE
jgi:hypothetical protein